ncbi:MAG: ABC transporter ATP-binding protein [Clostridia bacterium]|jgi:tungstate transport system ATP-binding protein|nr:ABC transporter ATP-binding protein [Clostridia bacterium]MDH7573934.1 ABC transporter ATP-binding protein [Clostridia bacterium]
MAEVFRLEEIEVWKAGRCVLQVPELSLAEGEVLGLIGPNGAGKTTLLLVLAGLEVPHRGRLVFRGREIRGERERQALRRRLAVVFQEPLLLNTTVYNNVAAGLRFRGMTGTEIRSRVHRWLARLGIADLARRPARALSGGEAQRVSLARALVLEPEILLLDEPFASLDAPTRGGLLEELSAILTSTGLTAVFVTHDFRELPALAHRAAALLEGRILQTGTPEEVLYRPASLELAAFVGVSNRLPAEMLERQDGFYRLRAPGGLEVWAGAAASSLPGKAVTALWRPEEGSLLRGAADSMPNAWPAVVKRILPLGAEDRVILSCGGHDLTVLCPHHVVRQMALEPGSEVCLRVPPERVHLLPA